MPQTTIGQHQRWVSGLVFSRDGKRLVSVGGDSLRYRPGDVLVWDAASGKSVGKWQGHETHVWSVACSPDGAMFVTTSYGGRIIVWDGRTGKQVKTLDRFQSWVRCAAFSPDGKHLAAGGEDGTIVVWTSDRFQEANSFKPHGAAVTSLVFLPGGKTILTAGLDNQVKLSDWKAGKQVAVLQKEGETVWSVDADRQGKRLVTAGSDRSIRLWDAAGKPIVSVPAHRDWVHCVRFSPDGKWIASGGHDRAVKRWSVDRLLAEKPALGRAEKTVADAEKKWEKASQAIDGADKNVAGVKNAVKRVASIVAWKEAQAKQEKAKKALEKDKENKDLKKALSDADAAVKKTLGEVDAGIKAVAADKKSKSAQEFAALLKKLKDAPLGDVKKELAKREAAVKQAEADAKKAVAAADTAEKALADAKKARKDLMAKLEVRLGEHGSSVWAVAFSPDGALLASGGHRVGSEQNTDTIKVWRLGDGKSLFSPAAKK